MAERISAKERRNRLAAAAASAAELAKETAVEQEPVLVDVAPSDTRAEAVTKAGSARKKKLIKDLSLLKKEDVVSLAKTSRTIKLNVAVAGLLAVLEGLVEYGLIPPGTRVFAVIAIVTQVLTVMIRASDGAGKKD